MLTRAAGRAAGGRAQVVVVEAGPGMGKSTLLHAFARGEAGPIRWLRCDALERELDHSAAELLLSSGPLTALSDIDVGRRLRASLEDLQATAPATLLVDDAQWMDPASARALRFALRRLAGARLLVALAQRPLPATPAEPWTDDPRATTRVRLTPFDGEATAELARRSRGWELGAETAETLARRAAGLPLLVAAATRAATRPTELSATAGLSRSLASIGARMLASADPDARRLVEASVVMGEPAELVVLGTVARVPGTAAAADAACAAGLLRVTAAGAVAGPLGLLRDAIYEALPIERQRALHRQCADETTGDRRLRHLVSAAEGPDPALVDDMVAAADRARATHDHRRAADHRLRARSVSASPQQRDALLLEAVADLVIADDLAAATALEPEARACPAGPLRSLALGSLAAGRGEVADARALLTAALDVGAEDPALCTRAALALSALHLRELDGHEALAAVSRCAATDDPALAAETRVARATGCWLVGDLDAALALLAEPVDLGGGAAQAADLAIARGMVNLHSGRPQDAREDLDRATRLCPRWHRSLRDGRPFALRARVRALLGDWDGATADASLARAMAERHRSRTGAALAHAVSVDVLAWRGRWDEARDQLARARRAVAEAPTVEGADAVLEHEVVLLSAMGRHDDVAALLSAQPAHRWARLERVGVGRGLTQLWIDSTLAVGALDAATGLLDAYEDTLAARPWAMAPARLHWLRGRVAESGGDLDGARRHYGDQVADPELAALPFLRAEVLVALGRAERALGDPAAAAARLLDARQILRRLGAAPRLAEVDAVLRSVGVPSDPGEPSTLTPREQEICSLAIGGNTNREIADALFITMKTVEYHLRNAYLKLGVEGRRGLRQLASRHQLTPPTDNAVEPRFW